MKTPKEPWGFCETPEEKCTMNYCDDNGCQNRKRALVSEEIPDPTAQLKADKEELIEKLEEIYGYLGSHFDGEKVSIGELIQKHKQ